MAVQKRVECRRVAVTDERRSPGAQLLDAKKRQQLHAAVTAAHCHHGVHIVAVEARQELGRPAVGGPGNDVLTVENLLVEHWDEANSLELRESRVELRAIERARRCDERHLATRLYRSRLRQTGAGL